ncbi:MAG: glucuronate isomerase [Eubacterium sp.]
MRTFNDKDFMLKNEAGKKLYHQWAAQMPIFDYHCHLDPQAIAEDWHFENLTELWLSGDHYKWRLMRAAGVDEKWITGEADPYEKYLKWAETIPKAIGNPIYHWTHLELKQYFGVTKPFNKETAPEIWEICNAQIQDANFSTLELLKRFKVKALSTTDDPVDDLKWHRKIKEEQKTETRVLPTFRPDKGIHLADASFIPWIKKLETATSVKISTLDTLETALEKRLLYFKECGCLTSDHSFGAPDFTREEPELAENAFKKALKAETLSQKEISAYHREIMIRLGRLYHQHGLVMQLHLGVIRNTNTAMYNAIGADAGFDVVGDGVSAQSISNLLDALNMTDELPKTVFYSLNENDNVKLSVIAGCFQKDCEISKVQLGSAWWYNDYKEGMERQLKAVANTGLLANFIGMLTDSRSFMSYSRHDYFRRILCNLMGSWIEEGEVPEDEERMKALIEGIAYNNAVKYFNL